MTWTMRLRTRISGGIETRLMGDTCVCSLRCCIVITDWVLRLCEISGDCKKTLEAGPGLGDTQ